MSPEIEKAYQYCESVTRRHAKSFYFAAKFLPRHKQRAVYPIYAFCRHVDDEIDEIGDGDDKLAIQIVKNWQSKLNEVHEAKFVHQENEKNNEQNLVFMALQDLLRYYRINLSLAWQLVEGVLMDTHIKRYETFDELYVYCYRVASTVGLMSSEILGYSDEAALEYAEAMGIGMQLTNILRDVKEDAAMGRIYLPLEDLRRFSVSEEQIVANEFDAGFAEMMKFQVARARDFYRKGETGIALLEKDSRFTVLLAARIYAKILDEIEKLDYNVFTRRAGTSRMQKLLSIPKIWLQTPK
jgi:phytoene synthase